MFGAGVKDEKWWNFKEVAKFLLCRRGQNALAGQERVRMNFRRRITKLAANASLPSGHPSRRPASQNCPQWRAGDTSNYNGPW